jgi:hypothetical protein
MAAGTFPPDLLASILNEQRTEGESRDSAGRESFSGNVIRLGDRSESRSSQARQLRLIQPSRVLDSLPLANRQDGPLPSPRRRGHPVCALDPGRGSAQAKARHSAAQLLVGVCRMAVFRSPGPGDSISPQWLHLGLAPIALGSDWPLRRSG